MPSWRGLINALLNEMQHYTDLNEKVVEEFAHHLIFEPLLDLTPQQQHSLLAEAVHSNDRLTGIIPGPHDEETARAFFFRLLARMEQKQPWPEPAYQRLPVKLWEDFSHTEPIARIGMRYVKIEECLRKAFRTINLDDKKLSVLILRLRSGETVAIAGPWWPDSHDVALLTLEDNSSTAVLEAFLDATPIIREDISLLPQ